MVASLGVPFFARAVDADEARLPGEGASEYLERIVQAKLDAARSLVSENIGALLVADTIVMVDGDVLGKPMDDSEASRMVRRIVGRAHQVSTRFAVAVGEKVIARTIETRVHVRALSADAIDAYVASGEGRDKAGAYAIQGAFGAAVKSIDGSYANVVGLPLADVVEALEVLGALDVAEVLSMRPASGA